MTATTTRLTDEDRRVIDKARELMGLYGGDDIADAIGVSADSGLVYPAAFGVAQELLRGLDAIVTRLGGDDDPAPILGYRVDGKAWHPSDVTIIRRRPWLTRSGTGGSRRRCCRRGVRGG